MDKPNLYVIARFLDILYSNGNPMSKTRLQMLSGLNYPRFVEYLEWLLQHELVTIVRDEEGVERVSLSSKGIESYYRLVGWIREFMNNIKI